MKILIVEDHAIVREGVRRLLGAGSEADTDAQIFEAGNAEDALQIFQSEWPDLVLLDLNLDGVGGLELLRRLVLADDEARIIVFSMHAEPAYAARALKAGARGYVSKSAPAEELLVAVQKVSEGGRYVDRDMAAGLGEGALTIEDPLQQLSVREVEILRQLGDGRSLAEIAEALGVAYKAVADICTQMKQKLGIERTADLIRLSVEMRRP